MEISIVQVLLVSHVHFISFFSWKSGSAGVTGGWVASLTAASQGVTDPLQTLPIYSHVFLQIGGISAVIAALMMLGVPALCRMIHYETKVPNANISANT